MANKFLFSLPIYVVILVVLLLQDMISSRAVAKATKGAPCSSRKQLYILRHGQATHNPRAEEARSQGCSQEQFMELMRQDDSIDSPLTALGQSQAKSVCDQTSGTLRDKIQLVVSSPLSRALQTADLAMPTISNRVCVEEWREINGWLLNAKRRTRTDLKQRYPAWNLDALATDDDKLWTQELESQSDCGERGYQGLNWILDRPEDIICLVCHGGILRFTMNQHDLVRMVDGRASPAGRTEPNQDVKERFGNCELRRYTIEWEDSGESEDEARRTIILTELDRE